VAIGRRQKHHRVGTVKGQALPAWDPRPLKAAGVTYCTSPMGADHTAGLVVNPGQPLEEIAQASQEAQILNTAIDSSGFCQFLMNSIEEIAEFYSLFYGDKVTREEIADIAWKCMEEEWEFNRLAGFGPEDDEMPESMKTDAIGPAKFVWDVPQEIVNKAYERFEPTDEFFKSRPS
jgi:aldehyde:ferredoxin oxidoreductase